MDTTDVMLQKTPITFDVSVWEFFWPLQIGARLVIAEPDRHADSAYLAELIAAAGVTTLNFVPSVLAIFASEVDLSIECPSLRRVLLAGEALPAGLAQQVRTSGIDVHNLYGPAEVDAVSFHRVVDSDVES
ncbi:AMP-binding protein, partial [Nocardia araoensis]|uniref:AMP-binding protein n=1 Tax=Nocardia araoensis TaxID=228600 RepID=UPI00247867C7